MKTLDELLNEPEDNSIWKINVAYRIKEMLNDGLKYESPEGHELIRKVNATGIHIPGFAHELIRKDKDNKLITIRL